MSPVFTHVVEPVGTSIAAKAPEPASGVHGGSCQKVFGILWSSTSRRVTFAGPPVGHSTTFLTTVKSPTVDSRLLVAISIPPVAIREASFRMSFSMPGSTNGLTFSSRSIFFKSKISRGVFSIFSLKLSKRSFTLSETPLSSTDVVLSAGRDILSTSAGHISPLLAIFIILAFRFWVRRGINSTPCCLLMASAPRGKSAGLESTTSVIFTLSLEVTL
jgi:hypothetical protein